MTEVEIKLTANRAGTIRTASHIVEVDEADLDLAMFIAVSGSTQAFVKELGIAPEQATRVVLSRAGALIPQIQEALEPRHKDAQG